jgi:O-methyltransferase
MDLLIRTLTRRVTGPGHRRVLPRNRWRAAIYRPVDAALDRAGIQLVRPVPVDSRMDEGISFLHAEADTSMGTRRLQFLQRCLTAIHVEQIPGDLVELGCWRGGGAILMRGFLAGVGDTSRRVWAADTFRGYPLPDSDTTEHDHIYAGNTAFAVSLEEVKERIDRYGLLDEQVRFLDGLFATTLPTAAIDAIALMHIDVSTYRGTADGLRYTYPKVSPGGWVVIGDYQAAGARRAVDEYRSKHVIDVPLQDVPQKRSLGVWWRKPSS